MENRDIVAGESKPPPMNDREGFPPLVGSHPETTLFKSRPPFDIDVSVQLQSEADQSKATKDGMLGTTSGKVDIVQGLQESAKSSPVDMIRGEIIPTTHSVQSTSSMQVTEPTALTQSERSDCSDCYENQARLLTGISAESQPLQISPILTQSEPIEGRDAAAELPKNIEACAKICPTEPEFAGSSGGISKTTPGPSLEESTLTEEPEITPVATSSVATPIRSHSHLDLVESATSQSLAFVTPTKKDEVWVVKKSPDTPTSDPGQASSAHSNSQKLNRRRSEIPSRTNLLSSPATPPILTHKKKRRVFTPVTESSSQSFDVEAKVQKAQPGRSVSSDLVATVGWGIAAAASENHVENKASLEIFNTSPPPTLEQEGATQINEHNDRTKQLSSPTIPFFTIPPSTTTHSTMCPVIPPSPGPSTLPLSKKVKQKHKAKTSKSKSRGRRTQSDLLVDTTAASSYEAKPRIYQNLPEPETPYLVDNQYIQPKIDKKVHADLHTTSTVEQHPQFLQNRVATDPVSQRGDRKAMRSSTRSFNFIFRPISDEPTLDNSNEASPVVNAKSFELTASHNDRIDSLTTDVSKGSPQASESSPEDTGRSNSSTSTLEDREVTEFLDHLSNEVSENSGLPFRPLHADLDSGISTTAVIASSSRHNNLSSSSTIGKYLSNDVGEGEMADLPVTPSNKVFQFSGSAATTPSTVVHQQTSNLASPRHVVVSDRGNGASAASTPTRRGGRFRRGHNRGSSLSSSQSSGAGPSSWLYSYGTFY